MPKYRALFQRLERDGLVQNEEMIAANAAPRGWLELAHDPAYVSAILDRSLTQKAIRRLGLPLTEGVVKRSCAAVGGTVMAGRLALEHGLAFNLAGGSHHAFSGFGAGFCVFNDVAVAARVLQAEGLVRRVVVIDLDVHQGDGTAGIFSGDESVRTCSMHCRVNFPVRKQTSDLDIALDADIGDAAYHEILDCFLEAALDFGPVDLAFYNAGVDPHERDRLGRLALSDAGLYDRERAVLAACAKRQLPLTVVMGGGYGDDVNEVAGRHALVHRAALAAGRP